MVAPSSRTCLALVLALAVMCSFAGNAAAQTSETKLNLQVPESLLLGSDTSVTLTLDDPGEPVVLFTNVGEVSATERLGGKLQATYTAPADRFSQVAIIVASTANQSILDWKLLILQGQPKILIESIKRADVIAEVGGKSFGPVRTDSLGHAKLQIIAPVGAREVTLTTTNRLGVVTYSSAPLNAPDFSRLLAVCPTGDSDDVLFFVSDAKGAPADEANIKIASTATTASARRLSPGRFAARVAAGSATDAEDIQVTSSLVGQPLSTSACAGKRPGALPISLDVQMSRQAFVAGESEAIQIAVTPRYPAGARRRSPKISLEAEFGSVSPLQRQGEQFVGTWTLPNSLDGQRQAELRVHSSGSDAKTVTHKQEIALSPGPASQLQMRTSERELRGDGESSIEVIAKVHDAFGNPIADAKLEGSTATLGPFVPTKEPGRYVARYGPVLAYEGSDHPISVREASTGASAALSIHYLPIKRKLVADLRVGYATNLAVVRAPSAALSLGYRTSLFDDSLIVGGMTGLYRSKTSEMADDLAIQVEIIGVPILATASYEHDLEVARLYAGAGAGLVLSHCTQTSSLSGTSSIRCYAPAGGGFLGGRVPAGPGHLVLQAAFWTAPIDEQSGNLMIDGNLLGLTFDLGYGFEL